jgi:hypothetical protein
MATIPIKSLGTDIMTNRSEKGSYGAALDAFCG